MRNSALVSTKFGKNLWSVYIPSVCCAPLTQKTAPLDEMISATSAVFLFYSVMLGFRVLISCEYTFNHNPCDELYGFHGLFTSCDPNFSGRSFLRNLRGIGAVSFFYRLS